MFICIDWILKLCGNWTSDIRLIDLVTTENVAKCLERNTWHK